MAEPRADVKTSSSYEEAYRKLYNAYRDRLKNSLEAIDNIVTQRQLKKLSKDDLLRAQHLAHTLAQLGTAGFLKSRPQARKQTGFLDKIIKKMTPEKTLGDKEFRKSKNF